jgi:hypothetical protein
VLYRLFRINKRFGGQELFLNLKLSNKIICNSSAPPPPNPLPPVEGEYLSADIISSLPLEGGGLGWG